MDTMAQTQAGFTAVQAPTPGGDGLRALLAQRGVQVRRRALRTRRARAPRAACWASWLLHCCLPDPAQHLSPACCRPLRAHFIQVVDFAGWQRVDAEEVARGAAASPAKPRDKLTSVPEMLQLAAQAA